MYLRYMRVGCTHARQLAISASTCARSIIPASEPNPLASVGGIKQDQAGIEQLRAHGVQLADGLEAWLAICEVAATFKA